MMENECEMKFHYYCFTFLNSYCNASVYMGFWEMHKINKRHIMDAKKQAKISKDAVLISVSYLGHMTSDDFNQEKEQPDS